ncbi:MAG: 9-O-acetylesterase [Cytophagales bacterium]|nr:9-O-acetylesterase [Armatimonadota bacterium]
MNLKTDLKYLTFGRGAAAIGRTLLLGMLTLATTIARADVTLPHLLSDGCVLQQKRPLRFWGSARAGEKVRVTMADRTATVTAGADGSWTAALKPVPAGGPYTLTVRGDNVVVVQGVLVGEVWVCSGQSNMNLPVSETENASDEIRRSADPLLRLFHVPWVRSPDPESDLTGGRWEPAGPDTTGGFTAAGYYFARELRRTRKVPIGLIHTSWGGTRIEAWTAKADLRSAGVPPREFDWQTRSTDPLDPAIKAVQAAYDQRLAAWRAAGSPGGGLEDAGRNAATTARWEFAGFDDGDWKTARVPSGWDEAGAGDLKAIDGGVWFRRTLEIPATLAGRAARLSLGAMDDFDQTFVNGVAVGATGPDDGPNTWAKARRYAVPAGILKAGANVVAVRLWDVSGGGGMTGPADAMTLAPEGAAASIPLAGWWRYRAERTQPSDPGPDPGAVDANAASGLYNAMLHPLVRYPIRGALWYQGESNAGNAAAYRRLLPGMITNWRRDWKQGDFPFYLAQLAPFRKVTDDPQESSWAELRESQQQTAKTLPQVAVAVITDAGDEENIHPRRIRVVGERLALLARNLTYGENVPAQSPAFRTLHVSGASAMLTFDHAGSGLRAAPTDSAGRPIMDGQSLIGFTVAGQDGRFVRAARAVISGPDRVTVTAPEGVERIVAVRFGWADFPAVNLWTKDGLPAAPFRTDAPLSPSLP